MKNKTIFYLNTCSTCQRIMKELQVDDSWTKREIKTDPITPEELDFMKNLTGSYEALFSRRSLKYRELGLNEQVLTESDYRDYILKEYTFLKRPVEYVNKKLFVGNTKAVVESAKEELGII